MQCSAAAPQYVRLLTRLSKYDGGPRRGWFTGSNSIDQAAHSRPGVSVVIGKEPVVDIKGSDRLIRL